MKILAVALICLSSMSLFADDCQTKAVASAEAIGGISASDFYATAMKIEKPTGYASAKRYEITTVDSDDIRSKFEVIMNCKLIIVSKVELISRD